tara:strand:+ start:917 stop:1045 length:129 start_codon:yes stop_codon:yes gene_type:complete
MAHSLLPATAQGKRTGLLVAVSLFEFKVAVKYHRNAVALCFP